MWWQPKISSQLQTPQYYYSIAALQRIRDFMTMRYINPRFIIIIIIIAIVVSNVNTLVPKPRCMFALFTWTLSWMSCCNNLVRTLCDIRLTRRKVDSIEFYTMEAERLKSLAEVERSVAVRQNIGVAFITFDDASVASRYNTFVTCVLVTQPGARFTKYLTTNLGKT